MREYAEFGAPGLPKTGGGGVMEFYSCAVIVGCVCVCVRGDGQEAAPDLELQEPASSNMREISREQANHLPNEKMRHLIEGQTSTSCLSVLLYLPKTDGPSERMLHVLLPLWLKIHTVQVAYVFIFAK